MEYDYKKSKSSVLTDQHSRILQRCFTSFSKTDLLFETLISVYWSIVILSLYFYIFPHIPWTFSPKRKMPCTIWDGMITQSSNFVCSSQLSCLQNSDRLFSLCTESGISLDSSSPMLEWSIVCFHVKIRHRLSQKNKLTFLLVWDEYFPNMSFFKIDLRSIIIVLNAIPRHPIQKIPNVKPVGSYRFFEILTPQKYTSSTPS